MAGALMQLVAYGVQDLLLTSNPDITFWKVNHRKYSNFAVESIEQTFSGQVDFGKKATATVSRNGDLMSRVYLQVDMPAMSQSTGTVAWTRNVGNVLINTIEIQVGGQTIDTHYSDWLNVWNELTQTSEKEATYNAMIGNTTDMTDQDTAIAAKTLYVPLQFWFCNNPGLALPLIALQYHEVKFNITFEQAANCYITDDGLAPTSGTPSLGNASLWIDYVFLDTDERRQFAQTSHEYLITQLQFSGAESFSTNTYKSKLAFNHPVKELVWTIQYDSNVDSGANRWSDYTDSATTPANYYLGNNPLNDAKLQLNGQDRFAVRKAGYFNLVQPYQCHTRGPAVGIYNYNFGLNPEAFQPSGTCNMSRIDSAVLNITSTQSVSSKLRVYATNINIFKVRSGLGGISYSN